MKPIEHGTTSGYSNYACRCALCTDAWRLYNNTLYKRRKVASSTAPRPNYRANGYFGHTLLLCMHGGKTVVPFHIIAVANIDAHTGDGTITVVTDALTESTITISAVEDGLRTGLLTMRHMAHADRCALLDRLAARIVATHSHSIIADMRQEVVA